MPTRAIVCAALLAGGIACGGGGSDDAGSHDTGTADASGSVPDARPVTPGPHWVGRVAPTAEGARFGWPGTGVVIRFRGTAAHATINAAAQYFTVVVDGQVRPPLAVSGAAQTYTLASDLSDATHSVELYRRTEGFFGPTVISDIEVDGELLGVPAPTRRLEVVGDSISCGYGVEGADETCNFSAATENHYLTYGAIAARAVGAELSTIAWSGKGVVFNYGDDTVEPLPSLYNRVIPTEDGAWTFDAPADAVVINLGTNDFSTDGDPTESQFVTAYVALLVDVRARHPDAVIFGTLSPGLGGGDDEARAVGYIQSAITRRRDAGDDRVLFADLRTASVGGFGCDFHPSVATHEAMAALLADVLRTELGW